MEIVSKMSTLTVRKVQNATKLMWGKLAEINNCVSSSEKKVIWKIRKLISLVSKL